MSEITDYIFKRAISRLGKNENVNQLVSLMAGFEEMMIFEPETGRGILECFLSLLVRFDPKLDGKFINDPLNMNFAIFESSIFLNNTSSFIGSDIYLNLAKVYIYSALKSGSYTDHTENAVRSLAFFYSEMKIESRENLFYAFKDLFTLILEKEFNGENLLRRTLSIYWELIVYIPIFYFEITENEYDKYIEIFINYAENRSFAFYDGYEEFGYSPRKRLDEFLDKLSNSKCSDEVKIKVIDLIS